MGNYLEVVAGVFDNSLKNIEKSSNHYQVKLEVLKDEKVVVGIEKKTYNGYVSFSDILVNETGLFKLELSSNSMTGFISTFRVYDKSVIEISVTKPDSDLMAKYSYNFLVSAVNISEQGVVNLDPSLITLYLNHQVVSNPSISGGQSLYSLFFPSSGTFNLKAELGEYFYSTELIISPSDNLDQLCLVAESSSSCLQCSLKSLPKQGKCECVYNSKLNSVTNLCECSDPSFISTSHCVPCLNYLKSSEIHASFSESYKQITISFSKPALNLDFDCKSAIKPGYYSDLILNCIWKSPVLLLINLKSYPDIEQGVIELNNQKIVARGESCDYLIEDLVLNIEKIYEVPVPQVEIEGPQIYSFTCSRKALKIRVYPNYNEYSYKWMPGLEPNNENLQIFIASNEKNQIEIPFEYLYPTLLSLRVKVQIKSLKTSIFKTLIVNITDAQLPVAEIIIKPSHSSFNFYQITAKVTDSCSSSTNLTFNWTSSDIPDISKYSSKTKPDVLQIPRKNIKNNKLDLDLKVSNGLQDSTAKKQLSLDSNTKILFSKSSGSISNKQDLEIAYSIQIQDNSSLQIIWTCYEQSGPCKSSSGNLLSLNYSNSSLTIKASDLPDNQTLTFTIQVTSFNFSLTESLTFFINSSITGDCDLPLPISRQNPASALTLLPTFSLLSTIHTFEWVIFNTTSSNTSLNLQLPYLIIPKNFLSQGTSYKVQLKIFNFDQSETIETFGTIETNQGPECEGVNLVKDDRNYIVSAVNCFDANGEDYPLMYQVGFRDAKSRQVWVNAPVESSQIQIWLPYDAAKVLVKVIDSLATFNVFEGKYVKERRQVTDYLMEVIQLTRNREDVPNLVVYYSKLEIDFATFAYLYTAFYGYFDGEILQELEFEVYVSCLRALLESDLMDQDLAFNSSLLTMQVLDKYEGGLDESYGNEVLELYSKSLLSRQEFKDLALKVVKKIVSGTFPPFQYIFTSDLNVFKLRVKSKSSSSTVLANDLVSVSLPKQLVKDPEAILDVLLIYSTSSSYLFEILIERVGSFYNYNIDYETKGIKLETFDYPITVTVPNPKRYKIVQCSNKNCVVSSSGTDTISVEVLGSGDFSVSESVKQVCDRSRYPISVSIVFCFVVLAVAAGLYVKDRKRRLVNDLEFGFCEMFNISSLFKPRQNLERVVSIFEISSSVLLIIAVTCLNSTKYSIDLIQTRSSSIPSSPFLSGSQTSGLFTSLLICQFKTLTQFLLQLCTRSRSYFHKCSISLNFIILSLSLSLTIFCFTALCVENTENLFKLSGFTCIVELAIAQPLMVLVFLCICRRKHAKVEPTVSGTVEAERTRKKKIDVYPLNETQNLVTPKPTYSRVNSDRQLDEA